MADYHSSLTGPEIDAALTRAKAGGEIDTLLAGKAPAGYGLGNTAYGTNAGTLANIDTYVENGWWRFDVVGTYDAIGVSANHSVLRVDAGRTIVQTLFLGSYAAVVTRIKIATESAWRDWEWVNPPMVAGVEYRTTERYHGKPVYCKLVDFGNLPNNTYKDVAHGISNLQLVISVSGESNGDNLIGNMYITYVNIGSTNIRIKTNADRSGVSATVLIKYTKTID